MKLHPLPEAENFNNFSVLCMNDQGQFIKPGKNLENFKDATAVGESQLSDFLERNIYLPDEVTDVFVWVHGWQNDYFSAIASARKLFNGICDVRDKGAGRYGGLSPFVPAFVVVHWPSKSSVLPGGYRKIRDRAAAMTEKGYAEFFLASLLGYLEKKNNRDAQAKVLKTAGGFYLHCLGHSFGGRFLTAAICAAANPTPPKILSNIKAQYPYTVDSLLVFQMAAPDTAFANNLTTLVEKAPLSGPMLLTHSRYDTANCKWHKQTEGECGIGCGGALEPADKIRALKLKELDANYLAADFNSPIVNIDANDAYTDQKWFVGSHSDFFYEESIHLLLSLVNTIHGP